MKRFNRYMMVIGILASSFAGGAVSHWVLNAAPEAHAASKRTTEDALRWSLAKPVYTRKLTVGDPKGKTSALVDGTGMKLYSTSGKVRINLDSSTGGMTLADTGGRERVKFGTLRGGKTGVVLTDSSGRRRVQIDDRGLTIFSSSGSEVGSFGFQSDGSMGVSVADKSGKLKRIDQAPKPAEKP